MKTISMNIEECDECPMRDIIDGRQFCKRSACRIINREGGEKIPTWCPLPEEVPTAAPHIEKFVRAVKKAHGDLLHGIEREVQTTTDPDTYKDPK